MRVHSRQSKVETVWPLRVHARYALQTFALRSWGGLAAREAVGGGLLEGADSGGEGGAGGFYGFCVFNFRDEGGTDYGGVGEAAEDGNVAGEGDAETYRDGELRDGAGAANECGEIVGESVFGAGYAGAGDEIEEAGRDGGDFGEALVGGSGRAK